MLQQWVGAKDFLYYLIPQRKVGKDDQIHNWATEIEESPRTAEPLVIFLVAAHYDYSGLHGLDKQNLKNQDLVVNTKNQALNLN